MSRKTTKHRLLAAALSLCMILSLFNGIPAFAQAANETGFCEHHTEHTAECGYAETVEGQPCTHEHDEECGFIVASEGLPCNHSHDETCGYIEGAAEIPCDLDCMDTDGDGVIDHVEGCAYTPAVEGVPCVHEHDDTCGYSAPTEGRACQHMHDDECGYVEPAAGHPCAFVCEICDFTVAEWTWVDPYEVLMSGVDYGFDDVAWGLAIPGISEEALQSVLPSQISATMKNGGRAILDVTWSDDSRREYKLSFWETLFTDMAERPNYYIYTAALPEGYTLDKNAAALEVLVQAADIAPADGSANIIDAYIKSLDIRSIADGGEPWDSDSTTPGNDNAADNKIVRSFDTIKYTIGVVPSNAIEYSSLPAELKVTLDADLTEAKFMTGNDMGWLNNWRVIYQDDQGTELLYQDATGLYAAGGESTTINDYLDTAGTDKLCGNDSPYRSTVTKQILTGTFDLIVDASGTNTLNIPVRVLAANNGKTFAPSFEVKLTGNPDNIVPDTISDPNANNTATAEVVTATAAPSYNIRVTQATRLAYPGYFDLSTGQEAAGPASGSVVRGQLLGYGITLELNNTAGPLYKGYLGVELPKGPITFTLDLTESVSEGSDQRTDNTAYVPILWDYKANNDDKKTTGEWGRNLIWNGTEYTGSAHWAAPWNDFMYKSNSENNAVYHGGIWNIDGKKTSAPGTGDRTYTVTVNGFDFDFDNYYFPDRDVGSDIYGDDRINPFSSGYVEVLVQFPETVGKTDSTEFKIEAKDMNAESTSGKNVPESKLEDNFQNNSVTLYPEGTFTKRNSFTHIDSPTYETDRRYDSEHNHTVGFLGTYYWGVDNDAVTFMGDTIAMWGAAQYNSKNWANIYAVDLLQKFDSAMLTINGDPSCEFVLEKGMDGTENDEGTVTFLYAVDPQYPQGYDVNKGGDEIAQRMNDTTEADYKYYTDWKAIPANEKCVAVLMQLRDCHVIPGTTVCLKVPMLVTEDEYYISKTASTTNIARVWLDKAGKTTRKEPVLGDDVSWLGSTGNDSGYKPSEYVEADLSKVNDGIWAETSPGKWEKVADRYVKAEHSNNGVTGHTGGNQYGMSVLVLTFKAKVNISVENTFTGVTEETAEGGKPNFNMSNVDEDGNPREEDVKYTLKDISTEVSRHSTVGTPEDGRTEDLTITVDIPTGIDLGSGIQVTSSENDKPKVKDGPIDIPFGESKDVTFIDENGQEYTVTITATKNGNDVTITIEDAPLGVALPDITFDGKINADFVTNNMELSATATITGDGDGRAATDGTDNNDNATITISKIGKTSMSKAVKQAVIHRDQQIDYSLSYSTDVPIEEGIWFYDILPYNDDSAITERNPDSDFNGGITVLSVSADLLPAGARIEVFYTTEDSDKVTNSELTDFDGIEDANVGDLLYDTFKSKLEAGGYIHSGTISKVGNSLVINNTSGKDITCVFFYVDTIPANDGVIFGLHTQTHGNRQGDWYRNSFSARRANVAGTTGLDSNVVETQVIDDTALTVVKRVAGDADEAVTNAKEYSFTITGPAVVRGKTYDLAGGGTVTFSNDTAPTTTVTITGPGQITITKLPLGTYQVKEIVDGAEIAGYELNVTYPNGGAATLAADGDQKTVTVTNTYTDTTTPPPTPETGNLTVSKTVTGNAGDRSKEFTFTVTLSDRTVNGAYGDMTFVNGVATFTLKHGESARAAGLSAGITYTVTEAEADQDGYTTSSTGSNGRISANGTAAAVFTNAKDDTPSEPGIGNLTVSKTVTGNEGDRNKEFHFTVTLSDTSINGTYGDVTFVEGVASFTLKHGESKTIRNLPEGITYTVTETEANQDGYTTSVSGESGTITDGGHELASFINEKPDNPPARPDNPPARPDNPPARPDNPPARPDNPPDRPDNPPDRPDNPPDEPDNPPDEPDNSPDTPDDVPQTGDNSHLELWVALMISSAIGLLGVGFFSNKKRKLFSAKGRNIGK